jgi:hypothetical protein
MVYQQLELCYSLISLTIPNLKGYLLAFNTGMGLSLGYTTQPYNSHSISMQLSSLKNSVTRSKPRASTNAENAAVAGKFRPEPLFHNASVVHGKGGGASEERQSTRSQEDQSIGSLNSQEMIIRRDMQWNVSYD